MGGFGIWPVTLGNSLGDGNRLNRDQIYRNKFSLDQDINHFYLWEETLWMVLDNGQSFLRILFRDRRSKNNKHFIKIKTMIKSFI